MGAANRCEDLASAADVREALVPDVRGRPLDLDRVCTALRPLSFVRSCNFVNKTASTAVSQHHIDSNTPPEKDLGHV
jgi:hypothetical protein